MPTRFTRRELAMVGASTLRASETAVPFAARPAENAADAPVAREGMLCGGNIHDDGGLVAVRIGINASHEVVMDLVVDKQLEAIASVVAKAGADPDALVIAEVFESISG